MSIANITGFDEHFELPDTLPERYSTPIIQTKAFGYCLALISIASTAALLVASGYFLFQKKDINSACSLFTTTYTANLAYFLITKPYYCDQSQRKVFREELSNNELTLDEFAKKHGWENIRRYGFHIAPNLDPIIDREQMHKIALFLLDNKPLSLFFHLSDKTNLPPISNGIFWELISHNLFSEEEIDTFAKQLSLALPQLSFNDILLNFPEIKKWNLDRYMSQQQIQYLENQLEEFEIHKKKYVEKNKELYQIYQQTQYSPFLKLILEGMSVTNNGYVMVFLLGLIALYFALVGANFIGSNLAKRTIEWLDPSYMSYSASNQHAKLTAGMLEADRLGYQSARKTALMKFHLFAYEKNSEFLKINN